MLWHIHFNVTGESSGGCMLSPMLHHFGMQSRGGGGKWSHARCRPLRRRQPRHHCRHLFRPCWVHQLLLCIHPLHPHTHKTCSSSSSSSSSCAQPPASVASVCLAFVRARPFPSLHILCSCARTLSHRHWRQHARLTGHFRTRYQTEYAMCPLARRIRPTFVPCTVATARAAIRVICNLLLSHEPSGHTEKRQKTCPDPPPIASDASEAPLDPLLVRLGGGQQRATKPWINVAANISRPQPPRGPFSSPR